jgi:hypothetical protein
LSVQGGGKGFIGGKRHYQLCFRLRLLIVGLLPTVTFRGALVTDS